MTFAPATTSTRTVQESRPIGPAFLVVCCLLVGCRVQPPLGSPIEPIGLGAIVDETNRMQEENAEAAKFIVYMHEFELNTPNHASEIRGGTTVTDEFDYRVEDQLQGFRLSPSGQDHVRQIARFLTSVQGHDSESHSDRLVVVERSDTSKRWGTLHRYPIHFNDELDETRRRVVVNALTALGVLDADQFVVVAPTFPYGLNSQEAATAYGQMFSGFQNQGRLGGGSFAGGAGGLGGFF